MPRRHRFRPRGGAGAGGGGGGGSGGGASSSSGIGFGQFYPGPPCFNFAQPSPFIQNPNFHPQQFPTYQARPFAPNPNELLGKVDRAVVKARRELVAARESVTTWKVSEAVLLALQVDSWSSLGFKMQQVPSLNHLISTEGKINAFIHCFIGVWRITTLHDLEDAICQNEGVEQFEDLELGPLMRHPLVVHYFKVSHDTTEVFKITSEEILFHLSEFIDDHKRKDMIETEKLLDFIAEKRSVIGWESLGVRVQSLGWHIFCIRKAKRIENGTVKKCLKTLKPTLNKRIKRLLVNSKKKQKLDDRFCAISHRFKSFSVNEEFYGKHIKVVTSSSGGEDSDGDTHKDCRSDNDAHGQFKPLSQSIKNLDQVSSCPYPSATEEMTQLSLKGDPTCSSRYSDHGEPSQLKTPPENFQTSQHATSCPNAPMEGDGRSFATSGSSKFNESSRSFKKKRGPENVSGILTAKQKKANGDQAKEVTINDTDLSLVTNSTRMFITTWKEACRDHTVDEVFEKMLQFYNVTDRQRKRMKQILSSLPLIELRNVAVVSMKFGLWDNTYDAFEPTGQDDLNNFRSEMCPEFRNIDVKSNEKDAPVVGSSDIVEHRCSVEDVIDKIATYFELDHEMHWNNRSPVENNLMVFSKLFHCESWVSELFCVKEFKSLGHGLFFKFLEKHASLLPNGMRKFLNGDNFEKFPWEVCLLEQQLGELVSQASNTLSENETVSKQMISILLSKQFPLLGFRIRENGSLEEFLDIVRKQRINAISKCVVFSAPFLGSCFKGDSLAHDAISLSEAADMRTDTGNQSFIHKSVTSKDAIEVLRKAPMLSDLTSWSHWNIIFAPSLGPLLEWLSNEVSKKELWCLLTEDGKVIRINPLATVDSFLEAAVKGSSFHTAVELLSIYYIVGGEKHVPLSLLKCHASRAFEVILKNYKENVEVSDSQNILIHGNTRQSSYEVTSCDLSGNLLDNLSRMNKAVHVASKFFLHCLGYFPSDHRKFAADVLLSGLRSVIKDVHSVILCDCNQLEQRIMLHDVGMSLGIVEWINDYHAFSSTDAVDLSMSFEASCLKAARSELDFTSMQDMPDKFLFSEEKITVSAEADRINNNNEDHCKIDGLDVSSERLDIGCSQIFSGLKEFKDATLVVELIRREEFGLDPSVPDMDSRMLRKQHARLGRALHCLSQELYCQDSHFLLELVQNADDNIYPESVEPTLTFILQETGITVLNNECGFSADNIRALCDVGNSTKKGSGAGYIGQKGIGFKSVFRVTDAPEIHSNGFHVKFDISEGQIGFVLPTLVPPCNVDMYSRLATSNSDSMDDNCWNTCILLPFKSKLSEENAMNSIVTMFSDLHPSLLLFLHRLQCIKFRNMLNNSLIVMRKEIIGDGIIKVSLGKEKMTWFVVSQKVRSAAVRRDVKTTEIALAFTLQESENGEYNPHLDPQRAFAFLPLRTYGLKFILQGDFVLPSSREEVDVNSPWNQWLLSEFPALFVSSEKSFCDLPCYRENPGKAITAYMSFVPLVGEVHGFFSSLPRMIISKLRMSNCLVLEGDSNEWVPPCMVLRGWNKHARNLLPESLLREHLGLGFLHKDIILSDSLARALGIEEYGPKILLQIMSSVCHMKDGLKSMGLSWLYSWLNEFHTLSFHSSDRSFLESGIHTDLIRNLRGIPFIPLSDGTYSSINEGTIWLPSDGMTTGFDGENGLLAFQNIYAKLRIVNPALFTALSGDISSESMLSIDNCTRLLHLIGVQRLSLHEITKVHILPALTNARMTGKDKNLMTEYLCFVMIHLHSSCSVCRVEREFIIKELRNKAFILTNHGFKRPVDVPIHFNKEFGNPVDINKMINVVDMKWHEVDIFYVQHPSTQSLSHGLLKWREFLQEIGVSDFVQIVQVDKNFADISHVAFNNIVCDRDLISPGSFAKDWESQELVHLLSVLSSNGNRENCKYLLEAFDLLWDDNLREKVLGYCRSTSSGDSKPFKSSFLSCICDVQWVASSIGDELCYPKDLFYDCDAVRSILGASAPYAVPKVRNEQLVNDIGFKTRVTLDDVIKILKEWISKIPFKASISQMCRLYTFISNELAVSKRNIVQELCSEPFIFVPYASDLGFEDVIAGTFLSPKEVYWHDSSGSIDLLKESNPQDSSISAPQHLLCKSLRNVYPGLYHFFVDECGVCDIPPLYSYLQILQQISAVALPSQAAKSVCQIFLKWADGLKSGLLSSEDVIYLKECLRKLEFAVLPSIQDKWVSLHPSFGPVCWCDDEKLKKEFKNSDNVNFLYFGKLSSDEKEMLRTKLAVILRKLGILAVSEVVTREAIYYGPKKCNLKASLVNWALPYAQRYMRSLHPDKYTQLKQSSFDSLNRLRVLAVDKLFYRNVIKSSGCVSKKRYECNCLLEDTVLYSTQEADSHSIFMELSRVLFEGITELHLSNFLHLITTMAESGSSEEQVEFFILNSQKVLRLPDEESVWSLSLAENDETLEINSVSTLTNQQHSSTFKRKSGTQNWPPADWKTAPGFSFARTDGLRREAATQPSSSEQIRDGDGSEDIVMKMDGVVPVELNVDWTIKDISPASTAALELSGQACDPHALTYGSTIDSDTVSDVLDRNSSKFSKRDQLDFGGPNSMQAMLTGRQGELVAFKYFSGKVGEDGVKWVNEDSETGLPYDIVIRDKEKMKAYIEVKATASARKDWFSISNREWQFAVENGESFSIAHVVLSGNNVARISVLKNPVKLCQQGKLQLVVMMPSQHQDSSVAS